MDLHDQPDELMACAVCAQILFPVGTSGTVVSWLHRAELLDVWASIENVAPEALVAAKAQVGHEPVDHVAVPVPVAEVRTEMRCDFCSQPNPTWVLPVEDFDASASYKMPSNWLVCEVCARMLKKGRWEQLTKRAITAMSAKHGVSPNEPRFVQGIKALHSQVREYQIGPVRRL